MSRIKALFYSFWFVATVMVVIVLMWAKNSSHRTFRRMWGRWQRYAVGYDIEIIGSPDPQVGLFIANHQSIMDIVVLEETHPANICWIAKKEIGELPIIGKILTLPKMIAVDRKNPRELVRIVHEVDDRIKNGRAIVMFPEGTRHRGTKMLKFQNGAKMIANKLGLKVQPIVLIGTGAIADSKEFRVRSGHVKIIYLDPVDTSDNAWLENTRTKMQAIIDEHENSAQNGEISAQNSTQNSTQNSEPNSASNSSEQC
ncbi:MULTISPECIES: lysophospholipid acyltransferase family protein [unclassified Campylobacter]|uniref:lysophospholipid acyltransferase family protein n=1 Tax=unclassified Campylobacter TaxID=2593542 RepID=UPI0022E9FD81|nr:MULTISPECIES: lysophospholipid acyltransferase family protein [unclassified Campylobacter]MDA3061711.1 1-acyl-sn-glycerol-3-phosphate acyltransferase [Campylobacter sp. JMF_14 EL1]MDA3073183.1 1-acyl-sn-glycerol-3-phosphate acyltransferase [Campylobacter sp. JMF_10 EL2]